MHEITSWAVDGVNRGQGHQERELFVPKMLSYSRMMARLWFLECSESQTVSPGQKHILCVKITIGYE